MRDPRQTWAGLRPKSPDGLPLLGKFADGLYVASGQYRNGILFTPAIADEMAAVMLGKANVIPDFDPRQCRMSGRPQGFLSQAAHAMDCLAISSM